jgi:hypothetical protein
MYFLDGYFAAQAQNFAPETGDQIARFYALSSYIPQIPGMITREFRPDSQARKACSGTPSRSRV